MKVGIIGGTGGMGEGFALRWCLKYHIVVGSRDSQKANDAAEKYTHLAREHYGNNMTGSITGDDNFGLARYCDVILLSIPYEHINDICASLAKEARSDCIIVNPIVPMSKTDNGFTYIPFEQGNKSAAELVADNLPPKKRVVSAFHTISEVKLRNIKQNLDIDTFVCGDDQDIIRIVTDMASEIQGLRSVYLGPLSLSYQAEILTPMLLNSAKRNKMRNPGIRLV